MGICASQARLLMLYNRKSDIEFRLQGIANQIMLMSGMQGELANAQAGVMNKMVGADQNGQLKAQADSKTIDAQLLKIQTFEKYLTQMQKTMETQHNEVSTEIDSVKKIIDKNVESSFKYMA